MNRKAISMSMNVVIVAVLCLIVLAVLIFIFSGKVGQFREGTSTCGGPCVEGMGSIDSCPSGVIIQFPNCRDGNAETNYCCLPGGNPVENTEE